MSKSDKSNSTKYSSKINVENMTFGIPEPVRKTMYDVVLENLEIADRKTYLHRLIIVGEHLFKDDQICTLFSESLSQANAQICYERVTGFLLHYNRHFIHMVEGDENAIHRQISCLFNHKLFHKLGNVKVLMHISHIKKRLSPDWTHYYGIPSKLLGEIKVDSTIQEAGRYLYTCVRKFFNFVRVFIADNYFSEDLGSDSDRSTHDGSLHGISNSVRAVRSSLTIASIGAGLIRDPYRVTLPETEMLDFILAGDLHQTLKEYHGIFGEVPQRNIYKDRVWPVPSDFIPYDVFRSPLNILTNLSNARKKQSVMEESNDNFEGDITSDFQDNTIM